MIKILTIFSVIFLTSLVSFAGNKDRQGEAGASELLINPWARSSGWDGISTACITGVESLNLNVAGLAFTEKTELVFAHTNWLSGTGIAINTFGLSQTLGSKGGVLGLSIMSIDFGNIPITTTSLPEGGLGDFSPQFINIGLAYAKIFSNSIYGGIVVRGLSESIADVGAFGIGIDAGIRYVTGNKTDPQKIKFGIALRNIGTRMNYGGDGLSFRGQAPEDDYSMTIAQRPQGYELPSLLNIGGSYDFRLGEQSKKPHRLTLAANFTSHAFSQDQFGGGLEYSYREIVMIRGAYNYQANLTSADERVTALTGLSGGVSFDIPIKKDGPSFGIDYSYRSSNPFNGTHSVGIRINL